MQILAWVLANISDKSTCTNVEMANKYDIEGRLFHPQPLFFSDVFTEGSHLHNAISPASAGSALEVATQDARATPARRQSALEHLFPFERQYKLQIAQ